LKQFVVLNTGGAYAGATGILGASTVVTLMPTYDTLPPADWLEFVLVLDCVCCCFCVCASVLETVLVLVAVDVEPEVAVALGGVGVAVGSTSQMNVSPESTTT
jgi:hypothetical protein